MQCSSTRQSGSETCWGALLLGGDGSGTNALDGGACTCNHPEGDRMCGGEGALPLEVGRRWGPRRLPRRQWDARAGWLWP